jgi:hypothetical protein
VVHPYAPLQHRQQRQYLGQPLVLLSQQVNGIPGWFSRGGGSHATHTFGTQFNTQHMRQQGTEHSMWLSAHVRYIASS